MHRYRLGMMKKGYKTAALLRAAEGILDAREKHAECSVEFARLITASEYIGAARANEDSREAVSAVTGRFAAQAKSFAEVCLGRGVATFAGLRRRRQSR